MILIWSSHPTVSSWTQQADLVPKANQTSQIFSLTPTTKSDQTSSICVHQNKMGVMLAFELDIDIPIVPQGNLSTSVSNAKV